MKEKAEIWKVESRNGVGTIRQISAFPISAFCFCL
jgi:hypothetical protein